MTEKPNTIYTKEQNKAYEQGWEAENNKETMNKDALCPYPIGHSVIGLRQYWFDGLYDNRFLKYEHIPLSTDNHASSTNSQTKTKNMGKQSK